jgi:hypothetical protein
MEMDDTIIGRTSSTTAREISALVRIFVILSDISIDLSYSRLKNLILGRNRFLGSFCLDEIGWRRVYKCKFEHYEGMILLPRRFLTALEHTCRGEPL